MRTRRDVWCISSAVIKPALVVFVGIILFRSVGPWLWTIDPTYADYRARNQGFTAAQRLGTDLLGRYSGAMMTGGGLDRGRPVATCRSR